MKYYLIYDKNNELIGYSTYRQFKGQVSVDEIPEKFVIEEEKQKEKEESIIVLQNTFDDVQQYLEDVASDKTPHLSKEEFKHLCVERKNARMKIKS